MGVQVGIVVGGGNIFRGVSAQAGSMDRATADYMHDGNRDERLGTQRRI